MPSIVFSTALITVTRVSVHLIECTLFCLLFCPRVRLVHHEQTTWPQDEHVTTQHVTTQHVTTQHITTRHNTLQHNTSQHNITRHNTQKIAHSIRYTETRVIKISAMLMAVLGIYETRALNVCKECRNAYAFRNKT